MLKPEDIPILTRWVRCPECGWDNGFAVYEEHVVCMRGCGKLLIEHRKNCLACNLANRLSTKKCTRCGNTKFEECGISDKAIVGSHDGFGA